ncbi:MAG: nucleotidyltransferase family protein [Microcystaceae cyanobacterium]
MTPLTPEKKRDKALAIAQRCINVLEKDFNAKEVILFGSLRGDAPWHEKSDLDLAVRGLSEDAWWEAYGVIEQMMPDWLNFDLVSLEKAPHYLRNYILQTYTLPNNPYLALKERLEAEILALDETVETLSSLLEQASSVPQAFVTPTLASYITDFYTSCERLSERVAVALDGGLPKGDNWHEQLLRQVSDSDGKSRPPLWQGSLCLELDEYRKFRHVARHNYNFKLQADKVLVLAQNVNSVANQVKIAVNQFNQWLMHKANETQP